MGPLAASAPGAAGLSPTVRGVRRIELRRGARRRPARVCLSVRAPLGDVAQLLRLGQRLQLLERLVLDLADALARDVERPPDLVQRAGMLAAEPVAQLEHAP